jgi:proteic killer suppression protein
MTPASPTAANAREEFLSMVDGVRPELHRYATRLTGSVIEGEDIIASDVDPRLPLRPVHRHGSGVHRAHNLHSIRVNDQWRIIFRWTAHGPEQVDVVDYHS